LSLAHLFWWDEAKVRVSKALRIPLPVVHNRNRYQICGDDALSAGQAEVSVAYTGVVRESGGQESPGKHFLVKSPNRLRGVFLERLFEFAVGSDGLISGGRRHASIPLRGFIRPEAPDVFRDESSRFRLAPTLKMLFSFDSCWASHPGGSEVLARLVSQAFPGLRTFAARLGLTNGLPIRFGGSGIPTPGGPGREARAVRARAIWSSARGVGDFPALLKGHINSTWQLASELSEFALNDYFADGTFVVSPIDVPPPQPVDQAEYVLCGTQEELQEACTVSQYRSFCLSLGDHQTPTRLGERTISKAIKAWKKKLVPYKELPSHFLASLDRGEMPFPDLVWVRRTRGPSGVLLYPRWVGEHLASEARTRAKLVDVAALSLQQRLGSR